MKRTALVGGGVVVGLALMAVAPDAALAQTTAQPRQATFTKDVAPILQRSCVDLPSARRDRADVADDLRGGASVGPRRSRRAWRRREMPPWHIDRTHRDPEVQGRSVADRRRDRDDRQVGGRGRAAGQPGRHAARRASSPTPPSGRLVSPTWSSSSRPTRCRPRVPTSSARCIRQLAADGRPLHQGDPDPRRGRRLAQGRSPRAVVLGRPG